MGMVLDWGALKHLGGEEQEGFNSNHTLLHLKLRLSKTLLIKKLIGGGGARFERCNEKKGCHSEPNTGEEGKLVRKGDEETTVRKGSKLLIVYWGETEERGLKRGERGVSRLGTSVVMGRSNQYEKWETKKKKPFIKADHYKNV